MRLTNMQHLRNSFHNCGEMSPSSSANYSSIELRILVFFVVIIGVRDY